MDRFDEGLRKLENFERHECCDLASKLLRPPHREGIVSDGTTKYSLIAVSNWRLHLGEGVENVSVKFCPWCGEHLEVEVNQLILHVVDDQQLTTQQFKDYIRDNSNL